MKIAKLLVPVLFVLVTLSCSGDTGSGQPADGRAVSADGLAIHYTATGSGEPAIVFVHGWSCDGSYWDAQVEHFVKTNRVVTIDLAGHGDSDLGREKWTMEAFGADVRAVVEELDLRNVVLVGHSMGGPVVVEAARTMPDRIIGIIGVDNFQSVDFKMTQEQIDGFVAKYETDFRTVTEGWVRTMFPVLADTALVSRVAIDMASGSPEAGVGALEELIAWFSEKMKVRLGELTIPLHCINSDQSSTNEEVLSGLVNGYKLRLMPGYGHFIFMEASDQFNSLLDLSVAEFAGMSTD